MLIFHNRPIIWKTWIRDTLGIALCAFYSTYALSVVQFALFHPAYALFVVQFALFHPAYALFSLVPDFPALFYPKLSRIQVFNITLFMLLDV